MKRTPLFVLSVFGLCSAGFAAPCASTVYNASWNGLTRQYMICVPAKLPANPAMVFYLHGTGYGKAAPWQAINQWSEVAIQNSFIVVFPLSTYNPFNSGWWYWQSYDLDFAFYPNPPDDAGFLRNLIQTLTVQYSANPNAIYMTGLSSGALMTQRMGVTSADLLAAIAPVSGQLYIKQMTDAWTAPPAPAAPISVLELHGDADTDLPYCGSTPNVHWALSFLNLPPVDVDVNFWLQADGLPPNPTPLCSGTGSSAVPTVDVDGVDVVGNGVEVKFVRELGVGHVWPSTAYSTVWQFFAGRTKE